MSNKPNYQYWGKADLNIDRYHLLPNHCLDVVALGAIK